MNRIPATISRILDIATPTRVIILAVVIIFFWLLLLGNQGVYQLKKLMLHRDKLELQKKTLINDISNLKERKEFLLKPELLEMTIRQELGYIKPGEILIQEKK
ncbi:MAG: septum formation initiator family protein [Pseudomonadota bacterium]